MQEVWSKRNAAPSCGLPGRKRNCCQTRRARKGTRLERPTVQNYLTLDCSYFFFLTSILQDFWVNYIYSKRNTTANASGNSPLFKELFLPWAPAPLPHPHPNHIFLGHMLNRALRNTFQTTYPRICLDSNQLLQTTSVGNFKPLCWLQPPLPSLAHSLRVRKDELR